MKPLNFLLMLESFKTFLTNEVKLNQGEISEMCALSTVKKLRRRQLWLKEGEVCAHKMFIGKGLFKTCGLSNNGMEYILHFSPENTWLTDLEGFTNGTPAKYNIEAMEECEIVQWNREKFHELFCSIPSFKAYMQKLLAKTLLAGSERIMANISYTAEEKYQHFITSCPDIFNRVPLHMVASYLGVSRETLTRLRRARTGGVKTSRIV